MIQRPRLLLIDDDLDYRRLLLPNLRRHFFVMEAGDGCEGYSRALTTPPDVIILDLNMNGWDGIETLRRFRENPRLANVPIAVLTANNQREIVVETIRAGATDYVLKTSMNAAELVTRVLHLLPEPTVV